MTVSTGPRSDPAMAEILASIRRIVADEEKQIAAVSAAPPGDQGEVLELTEAMRVDPEAEVAAQAAAAADEGEASGPSAAVADEVEASGPSAAETGDAPAPEAHATGGAANAAVAGPALASDAVIADLVRAALQDELQGPFGAVINDRIRQTVREELARAIEELAADS